MKSGATDQRPQGARELEIHREILGSVLLLKESAELRRLTVALLEEELRPIRRVEREHGVGG